LYPKHEEQSVDKIDHSLNVVDPTNIEDLQSSGNDNDPLILSQTDTKIPSDSELFISTDDFTVDEESKTHEKIKKKKLFNKSWKMKR